MTRRLLCQVLHSAWSFERAPVFLWGSCGPRNVRDLIHLLSLCFSLPAVHNISVVFNIYRTFTSCDKSTLLVKYDCEWRGSDFISIANVKLIQFHNVHIRMLSLLGWFTLFWILTNSSNIRYWRVYVIIPLSCFNWHLVGRQFTFYQLQWNNTTKMLLREDLVVIFWIQLLLEMPILGPYKVAVCCWKSWRAAYWDYLQTNAASGSISHLDLYRSMLKLVLL